MIFRDDDISRLTRVDQFDQVHRLFEQHRVTHTVALIMEDLDQAPDLVRYLRMHPHLELQLHCWNHVDLTTEPDLKTHLRQAIGLFEELFDETPTVLYPPWNRCDDHVRSVAGEFAMTARPDKISLSQYIRVRGGVAEDTINFHYWAYHEVMLLPAALYVYKNRQRRR